MFNCNESKINSIVVFRALKLGDMLCFIPTLRALREKFPKATISLVSHPAMGPLFERFPQYIDEFIAFPGFPGMPEQDACPVDTLNFLTTIQRRQFDLALQFHGSGEISNLVLKLFNAKMTGGFYRLGNLCLDPEKFKLYPEDFQEVLRTLSYFYSENELLGKEQLEFPLSSQDESELQKTLEAHGIDLEEDFLCLHPGASTESKCWAPENFARVGDYLIESKRQVVFTGSAAEGNLVKKIQKQMSHTSIDTARLDLSLGQIATLINKSAGLICNDTGVSHLAAALQKKSIVLFSQTDPRRWAPANKDLHRTLYRPSFEEVLDEIKNFLLQEVEVI